MNYSAKSKTIRNRRGEHIGFIFCTTMMLSILTLPVLQLWYDCFVLRRQFFLLFYYLGQILTGKQIVRFVPITYVLQAVWVEEAVFL